MPITTFLPKEGAAAPSGPPVIPTKLVEMDLGNLVSGGIWDQDLWDSTFIWGPVAPTFPEDITEYVRAASTSRGATNERQRVEAGTATIELDNRDGRFTPFLSSSPYYPNILPMRRIRIKATWNGVFYPVFYGFVESWPVVFNDTDTTVQVQLVDGFSILALMEVSGDFPEQQSGERIGAILDAAGWLTSDRDLDPGTVTVPAITLENVAPLEHIQQIEYAEGGRFFMAADGKATFRDRTTQANVDLSDRTWADDGTGMSYKDVTPVFDHSFIVNDIRLSRTDGVEQSVSSQNSQDAYGVRAASRAGLQTTDIQLSSDSAVADFAVSLGERYFEPRLRLESLVDNAMQHRLWEQVLPREISDAVAVIETTTQTAQVSRLEGIAHELQGNEWVVTVSVSPTVVEQAGIWDDAVYGLWDETFIWAR